MCPSFPGPLAASRPLAVKRVACARYQAISSAESTTQELHDVTIRLTRSRRRGLPVATLPFRLKQMKRATARGALPTRLNEPHLRLRVKRISTARPLRWFCHEKKGDAIRAPVATVTRKLRFTRANFNTPLPAGERLGEGRNPWGTGPRPGPLPEGEGGFEMCSRRSG